MIFEDAAIPGGLDHNYRGLHTHMDMDLTLLFICLSNKVNTRVKDI